LSSLKGRSPRHNVQGISDHYGVLLEAEWGENCHKHQVERLVPVYHKTNVTGLQSFLRVNRIMGK